MFTHYGVSASGVRFLFQQEVLLSPRPATGSRRRSLRSSESSEFDSDCENVPDQFTDIDSDSCLTYQIEDFCNEDGSYGTGWDVNWGTFDRYARDGVDVTQACCACGGGTYYKAYPPSTPLPPYSPYPPTAPPGNIVNITDRDHAANYLDAALQDAGVLIVWLYTNVTLWNRTGLSLGHDLHLFGRCHNTS
eukprot:gene21359-25669_t